jgi:hypothetical protein
VRAAVVCWRSRRDELCCFRAEEQCRAMAAARPDLAYSTDRGRHALALGQIRVGITVRIAVPLGLSNLSMREHLLSPDVFLPAWNDFDRR